MLTVFLLEITRNKWNSFKVNNLYFLLTFNMFHILFSVSNVDFKCLVGEMSYFNIKYKIMQSEIRDLCYIAFMVDLEIIPNII